MKIVDDNKEDMDYPVIADVGTGTVIRYNGKPHMICYMENDEEYILVDLDGGEAFHVGDQEGAHILEDVVLTINGSKQKVKK